MKGLVSKSVRKKPSHYSAGTSNDGQSHRTSPAVTSPQLRNEVP
jgi:hypothetical protein